ncbi:MAG: hypothetical protein ACFFBD_09325 [Candidatus Hodarchaeota archaeon]
MTKQSKFPEELIPSKEELEALYNGTHEACKGKAFSLQKIAAYYTEKYQHPVSYKRVRKWFKYHKIQARDPKFQRQVLIPSEAELRALYNGTHEACKGEAFSLRKIAAYYTEKYQHPVSPDRVRKWFKYHKIQVRGSQYQRDVPVPPEAELRAFLLGTHNVCKGKPFTYQEIADYYNVSYYQVRKWFEYHKIREPPIPPEAELRALYNGTHEACKDEAFTLQKIASYYTEQYQYPVGRARVRKWFEYHEIQVRVSQFQREIPIPPEAELRALYNGTHDACKGKPFTYQEIADYYSEAYQRPATVAIVFGWFRDYRIQARDPKFQREIPIPPEAELWALYNGTHDACKGKPFTYQEIADYYSEEYQRPISGTTVAEWFIEYEIQARDTRFQREIPIPPEEELWALYNGTHSVCKGKPFSQQEIAEYYSKVYQRSVCQGTVCNWFTYYGIQARDPKFQREIPIPPEAELRALYNGTHDACNGKPFSYREIAEYYTKVFQQSVSHSTVAEWFEYYTLQARCPPHIPAEARLWEDITYEYAEFRLINEIWTSGHGKHRVLTPNIPGSEHIQPEIKVFLTRRRDIIKKIIDAKLNEYSVHYKDTHVYPFVTQLRLVEFWCLYARSRVEIYYPDRIVSKSLDKFNENDYFNSSHEKIFVYKNSDDLIAEIQQYINENNKDRILDLIDRIRLLQAGAPDRQASLGDFLDL